MKRVMMILALGLALAASAWAQHDRGMIRRGRVDGPGMEGRFGMDERPGPDQRPGMPPILDLSEEQQTQAKALWIDHFKAMKPLHDAMAEKQVKLDALRTAEKVDSKAIDKLIEEVGAIRINMEKKEEAHRQAFRALLTEEQRVLMDTRPRGGCPGPGRNPETGRPHRRGAPWGGMGEVGDSGEGVGSTF